jgi:hypothetical protein
MDTRNPYTYLQPNAENNPVSDTGIINESAPEPEEIDQRALKLLVGMIAIF